MAEHVAVGSARVFFAPNDETTARYAVGRLGRKAVKQQSKSTTKGSVSRQTSEAGRDRMMPQELRTLRGKEQIVFAEGAAPVRGRKIVYFKDRAFRKRRERPSGSLAKALGSLPEPEIATHKRLHPTGANSAAISFSPISSRPPAPSSNNASARACFLACICWIAASTVSSAIRRWTKTGLV